MKLKKEMNHSETCQPERIKRDNWIAYTLNETYHRLDGPAYEDKDIICWWKRGQRHNPDGAACINKVTGYKEWWLEGEKITKEIFIQRGIGLIRQLKAEELFTPLELISVKNSEI